MKPNGGYEGLVVAEDDSSPDADGRPLSWLKVTQRDDPGVARSL
jgi:hypothetical protein